MTTSGLEWGPTFWLAAAAILSLGLVMCVLVAQREGCVPQTLTAFALQSTLAISFFVIFGLVADDATYHASAAAQARVWETGGQNSAAFVGPGKQSITFIVGTLYYFLGLNPLFGTLFMAVLMAGIPTLMAVSSRNFGMRAAAPTAAWLGAVAPPFLMWAPWLRREGLAFFLLSGVVLGLSMVYCGKMKFGLPMLVALALALAVTRAQLVLVVACGSAAAWILAEPLPRRIRQGHVRARVVTVVGVAVVMVAASSRLISLEYWRNFLDGGLAAGIASNSAEGQHLRVSGASWGFNSSPTGLAWNLIREWWGPPLWEWQSSTWVLAGLDGLFYLLLTLCILQAWRHCPRHRRPIVILVVALAPLFVGTALTMANYGIVMRVRAHFLPFLIPAVALYLHSVWARRRRHEQPVSPPIRPVKSLQMDGRARGSLVADED